MNKKLVTLIVIFTIASCTVSPPKTVEVAPTPVIEKSCCQETWGTTLKSGPYKTKLTAYYPANDPIEGGFTNRYGGSLHTLQSYLDDREDHVSVALDKDLGRVKRKLCSPQMNEYYVKNVKLFVEDTGSAFTGKGFSRADICVANRKSSFDTLVNSTVDLFECAD